MRLICFSASAVALAQAWVPQQSGVSVSLRGVSVVSSTVVWASGEKGTYLRTMDGGINWRAATVPGAADLDFRAVRAVDARLVYLMSAGPGEKSRIYKTADGGGTWMLQFTNPDPKGFFDALAFWDDSHGIVLGDPVDGRFVILTTADGGGSWHRQKTPSALSGEGAFAASNTCLIVRGLHEVWFATSGARVFHSMDGGQTWTVTKTPSAGIFSLAFSDRLGVAVGGDYMKPAETAGNIAVTADGGKTWSAPPGPPPSGYRSAVVYIADRKMWIAAGTSGSDVSIDDAKTWKLFDSTPYNALSGVWAVGPKGAIARLKEE